jgi:type IV fimbrial biogenesis protein FimT
MVIGRPIRAANAGFTLVELVATVTILGVLMMIAAPGFRQLTLNQGIKSAAFDIFSALEYARSEAIKRPGETVTLKPETSGSWTTGWRLVNGADVKLRGWTVAPDITVTDKNGTPLTAVTFGKDGHLTVQPKFEVAPSTTISGVTTRCVKVDLMGRAYAQLGACT